MCAVWQCGTSFGTESFLSCARRHPRPFVGGEDNISDSSVIPRLVFSISNMIQSISYINTPPDMRPKQCPLAARCRCCRRTTFGAHGLLPYGQRVGLILGALWESSDKKHYAAPSTAMSKPSNTDKEKKDKAQKGPRVAPKTSRTTRRAQGPDLGVENFEMQTLTPVKPARIRVPLSVHDGPSTPTTPAETPPIRSTHHPVPHPHPLPPASQY